MRNFLLGVSLFLATHSHAQTLVHGDVQQMINQQIASELQAAYLYLAMSTQFEQDSYDGFAQFFLVQFYEELNHARKLMAFMNATGSKVKLQDISAKSATRWTPLEAVEESLKAEQAQTAKIHAIVKLARDTQSYQVESFFDYFVEEQVEEEDLFSNLRDQLKRAGTNKAAILLIEGSAAVGGREFPALKLD